MIERERTQKKNRVQKNYKMRKNIKKEGNSNVQMETYNLNSLKETLEICQVLCKK